MEQLFDLKSLNSVIRVWSLHIMWMNSLMEFQITVDIIISLS